MIKTNFFSMDDISFDSENPKVLTKTKTPGTQAITARLQDTRLAYKSQSDLSCISAMNK